MCFSFRIFSLNINEYSLFGNRGWVFFYVVYYAVYNHSMDKDYLFGVTIKVGIFSAVFIRVNSWCYF